MLKNKKILIAGAGGLLGSHTVNALLDQNATVIAADIDPVRMKEQLQNQDIDINNARLSLMQLDITSEEEVIHFFEKVEGLDGAVNCTYPRNKNYGSHFFDVRLKDFNENLSLHLGSAFLFTQQCAAYFIRNKTPFSLVNLASIYGVVAPRFDIYAHTTMTMPVEYAAIKSAIIHLNKYAVKYVSDSNFRVNSVSPGGIFDHQPEPFLKAYKQHTLGKGMLELNDISGAISFLLSENSRYINGQNLIVDDGFSL
ncbi:oxidoreductase [Fluoribacter dumoffii]|uniref:oxidoreductase n=1 Tax=Fluoribacter dumoffii TaxID=463 RepID=UPI0022431789|nr:oxidoreductase [Fluoribacter dumoffii]MCW8387229.1 oxidoreductase [Fluoribacter dumoffii]MCW8497433.1 oxidoreductase [Fluoribacter dumoffii]